MTATEQNGDGEPPVSSPDGRQSQTAAEIARGTQRMLARHGFASLAELPLPNGRRADLVALSQKGEIWIIEIKSSIEDFRSDQKWPEYRDYCDRLLFAVKAEFPTEILPGEAGLILADRYSGEVVREAPEYKLAGGRRKSMMLLFARAAAFRLTLTLDPPLAQIVGQTLKKSGEI